MPLSRARLEAHYAVEQVVDHITYAQKAPAREAAHGADAEAGDARASKRSGLRVMLTITAWTLTVKVQGLAQTIVRQARRGGRARRAGCLRARMRYIVFLAHGEAQRGR